MPWMILAIVVFLTAVSGTAAMGGENCRVCHRIVLTGAHAATPCLACHLDETRTVANPAAASDGAVGCRGCHRGYGAIFSGAMGSREREKSFAARTYGGFDPRFYEKNCNSCHLKGCLDCHGGSGHRIARADDAGCLACHKGYFVGSDYRGRAPREDNMRYQRGEVMNGETSLKMIPDVHYTAGLRCGDCHSMESLVAGEKTSRTCLSCHRIDRTIVEHRIPAHLEKMECYACHSAWGAQEYGTFYLRFTDSRSREEYDLKEGTGEYLKSAYLKKQDAPPLGLNAAGKVSPIRPEFIAYFTDIVSDRPVGKENRLLAAEWKAYFPHTIRRGTVLCEGCHDNPRRFLLELAGERIYRLQQDGMTLESFWEQRGQRVTNGSFFPGDRYRAMSGKSPQYRRAYVEKWKNFTDHVDSSSSR